MTWDELVIDHSALAAVCRRRGVRQLEAFGSFATGNAHSDSDIDLLVTFDPGHGVGLEFVALQQELATLLDRRVDLLTRDSLGASPNKYLRRFALSKTVPIHVSS